MDAPVNITGVLLETERLILRPWQQSDLQDFYDYASVDGVGQMAGWLPHQSLKKSQQILDSFIAGKKTFALVEKMSNKVIGSLWSLGAEPAIPPCDREEWIHIFEPSNFHHSLGRGERQPDVYSDERSLAAEMWSGTMTLPIGYS